MRFNLRISCTPGLSEPVWIELVHELIEKCKGVHDMEDGSQVLVEAECIESYEYAVCNQG